MPNFGNNKVRNVVNGRHRGLSYEWDSLEAFMEDLAKLKTHPGGAYNAISSDLGLWSGITIPSVMRECEYGNAKLAQYLRKMLRDVQLELPDDRNLRRRRVRVRDDHGDSLDMPRVWAGDLERAWSRPQRVTMRTQSKRITVVLDVTANGGVTTMDGLWRAALAAMVCERLVADGRVIEMWVIDSTSHILYNNMAGPDLWAAWCAKRSEEPLVLERLVPMFGVDFMRTAGFCAMRMGPCDVPHGRYGGAIGDGLPATLKERKDSGETIIRISQCYSREAAIAEYTRALAEVSKNQENT